MMFEFLLCDPLKIHENNKNNNNNNNNKNKNNDINRPVPVVDVGSIGSLLNNPSRISFTPFSHQYWVLLTEDQVIILLYLLYYLLLYLLYITAVLTVLLLLYLLYITAVLTVLLMLYLPLYLLHLYSDKLSLNLSCESLTLQLKLKTNFTQSL